MKQSLSILLVVGLLGVSESPVFASAANVYLSQSGAGAGDGNSCGRARAVTYFNSSSNWGAGAAQIGPGTTVHLCGVFTGAANTTMLTFQGNGTAGSPITLLFEAGAILTSTNWAGNGAIFGGGTRSYIVIDGGLANGEPQGIIRNTDNGSSPTYRNQTDSGGIIFSNCTGCTIKNLNIQNLYIRNSQSDVSAGGDGIHISAGDNNRITNNRVNDSMICIAHGLNGTQNSIEMDHNKAWHCNWAFLSGAVVNINVTNYSLHDNEAWDWSNWDNPGQNQYHHNGLHMFMEAGAGSQTVTNPMVYNNYFHGSVGTYMTAMLYFEANTGTIVGARVFNNIFSSDDPAYAPTNGFINYKANNTAPQTYNNVFNYSSNVGGNCWLSQGALNADIRNNVFMNCGQVFYVPGGNIATSDYNSYYGYRTFDGSSTTLAARRTSCSCDSHSIGSNPLMGTNFRPMTGSPLLGTGVNLSGLVAALSLDRAGSPRLSSWDIGAFQGSPQNSGLIAPTPTVATVGP